MKLRANSLFEGLKNSKKISRFATRHKKNLSTVTVELPYTNKIIYYIINKHTNWVSWILTAYEPENEANHNQEYEAYEPANEANHNQEYEAYEPENEDNDSQEAEEGVLESYALCAKDICEAAIDYVRDDRGFFYHIEDYGYDPKLVKSENDLDTEINFLSPKGDEILKAFTENPKISINELITDYNLVYIWMGFKYRKIYEEALGICKKIYAEMYVDSDEMVEDRIKVWNCVQPCCDKIEEWILEDFLQFLFMKFCSTKKNREYSYSDLQDIEEDF